MTMLIGDGKGRFREATAETGEPAYLSRPNIVAATTTDINADGREDFVLLYSNMGAHFYFNRGFRCFGYSIELELGDAELDGTDAAADGQQALAVADFDGKGGPQVVVVTAEGQVWYLTGTPENPPAMGLHVALPAGMPGPVTVTAVDGTRALGARVARHGQPAYFGKVNRGPLALTWRDAAGKEHSHRVIVLGPTRFVLPKPE
jgi:hypothetical protein